MILTTLLVAWIGAILYGLRIIYLVLTEEPKP